LSPEQGGCQVWFRGADALARGPSFIGRIKGLRMSQKRDLNRRRVPRLKNNGFASRAIAKRLEMNPLACPLEPLPMR
jgi:hypothetical protein